MSKIWKRSLSLFLAIVMVVGILPVSAFATEQECAHENVEYIDEPATCVWEGYYAEYCNDCQQYLVEELLSAVGHDWVDGVCTVCGEAEAVEPEAEEPAETPDAEINEEPSEEEAPVEEEADALNPVEAPVLYANTREENGVILHGNNAFLDKSRDNDLMTSVMKGGLKTMVLDALNTTGDKVYYVSGGNKYDVTSLTDLAAMYDELKDVLTGQAALRFQVVRGGSVVKDEYVTLRNIAHLQFNIEIPAVESKGEPANLKAAVQSAMENAVITVTHGGDVIDHELMSDKLFKVEYIFPEDAAGQWPVATKSVESDFAVKVTIFDSVDQTTEESGIAYVTLKDTTPTYTVTFNSNGAAWKQFKVIEGQELPVAVNTLKPTRAYYTFNGWDKTVETTVTADAVYEAQWVIADGLDQNGNGTPDPLENFNIQFLLNAEDAEAYASTTAKYGTETRTLLPADPEQDGKIFLGWAPLNSTGNDAVIAEIVTDHAIYVAKWADAADEYVVTYIKNRIGGSAESFNVVTENGFAEKFDYNGENQEWDGWYIADAAGESTGVKFDFTKTVDDNGIDEAYLVNNKLTLVGTLGVNAGGNEYIDGTENDPYTKYVFQWLNNGVWEDLFKPAASYDSDASTSVNINDLGVYFDPNDDRNNDQLHIGWKEDHSEGGEYSATVYLRPEYADDYNNNDVDDALESAKITVNDEALGSVDIPNHTVTDGNFLANTNGDTLGKNGYETKIVVTPAKSANSYVSKILINGVEQELNFESNGTAWILLHEAKLTASKARSSVVYDIQVIFETLDIKFKATPDAGVLIPGKTYTDADMAEVYDAVVASPLREDAEVTVSYVAREEEKNVTVSVAALRKDIELRYSKLSSKILDKVWPGDTVTVDLTEVTNPISYQAEGMVKTPQQVVDSYILELQGADIAELLGVLATLKLTIQAKVKEQANIRPFLYNANGDSFEETLIVNYVGNHQNLNGTKTYTIADGRTTPTITASAKNVTVGKYTDADLLAGVTISPNAGAVKLADSFVDRNARTYNGVPVYFAGNENYKPASAKFNLTINKAKLNGFTIENVIAEPAQADNYAHRAAPKFGAGDPADVDYIAVVAGLDLNDVDLDLAASTPVANLKNVKAKAWIHLPDYLEAALQILGVDTSAKAKRTLDQVEDLFEEYKDALVQLNVSERAINAMLKVLRNVNEYADADAELEIVFAENVYPSNPGVYVNLGVVTDPRFETEVDFGAIMIAPVVALPDRGDVQLSYDGRIENVYAFESDGTDKPLDVLYKGSKVDAGVFYFGLNSKLAVQSGVEDNDVPNLPGIYLASTVYVAEDANGDITRLGSDVALVVITLKDVDFDVVSTIIEEDGNGHRPEIKVSASDAAYTLISAEVQVEADGDINLDDVKGTVNIEFPSKVYSVYKNLHQLWKEFYNNKLTAAQKAALPEGSADLAKAKIDPQTLVDFLNWIENRLNGYLLNDAVVSAINKLSNELNVPENYTNTVKENYLKVLDKLQAAAEKLVTAAEKAQNNLNDEVVVITFEPGKTYDKNGVYYYFGIVTDPDYNPVANGGVMIIKAPDDALVLLDTHVPYDGTGKEPMGWDNTNREGITFVVDQANKTVTFFMDNTAKAAVAELETKVGGSLHGKTVAQMYSKGEDKVEALIEKICTGIKEKAIDRIPEGTAQDKVNELLAKIDSKLPSLNTKLSEKLEELRTNGYTILMADKLEEPLPTEVGTYKFFAYSYAIEVAKADLTIEPIYVRVAAQDNTKVYDGKDGLDGVTDLKKPVESYYSYSYVEGQTREDNEVAISNAAVANLGVTVVGLDLKYDTICNGIDVGEYDIKIQNATISDNYDFMAPEVDTEDAKLTITAREIKVSAGEYKKYYMDAEPEYTGKIVEGSVVEGDNLDFTVTRANKAEDVGTYALTIALDEENSNYKVTIVDGGTLTIEPAKITVKAKDIEKQFDKEDDFENEYEYTVTVGLGTYTEEQIAQLLKDMAVRVEREVPAPADEQMGDTAVLVVKYNESDNVIITTENGLLTVGLGDYVCWNMQTGVYYYDVNVGLTAAVDGETIQMLKDDVSDATLLWGKKGTTLDLNGFTVEADYVIFVNESNIVDYSASNEGLLIPNYQITLGVDNDQVPIYVKDLGGYLFSDYVFQSQLTYNKNTDIARLVFTAYLETKNGLYTKYLADGASDNELAIAVEGDWKFETGSEEEFFKYYDSTISTVVGSFTTGVRQMYTFELSNCAQYMEYGDIELTPVIYSLTNGAVVHGVTSVIEQVVIEDVTN